MKRIRKQSDKKAAFTIIELLTVMSVIIILIGLLVPALNRVKRYAKEVKQRAQFHSIDVAMELFQTEHEGYPPSDAMDTATPAQNYCGAMKLAEAMMGQDLLGFHPDSLFRSDGTDASSIQLYPKEGQPDAQRYAANLKMRTGPYLQLENANAHVMQDLWTRAYVTSHFNDPCDFVLCDVYSRVQNLGTSGPSRIGMPMLYYKADTSKIKHDDSTPDDNIYDHRDNDELVKMDLPFDPTFTSLMASTGTSPSGVAADKKYFYENIRNENIPTAARPYRYDSYILISAGFDGEYGTRDDILNFQN